MAACAYDEGWILWLAEENGIDICCGASAAAGGVLDGLEPSPEERARLLDILRERAAVQRHTYDPDYGCIYSTELPM